LRGIVGDDYVLSDQSSLTAHAADALGQGHLPDLVVVPASTSEIAAIARLCNEQRIPPALWERLRAHLSN
jgi:FAD/FMN-containing dehydrogenase